MFEILPIIGHAVMITMFVFTMMLLVDYINVLTKGKMQKAVKGGRIRQYFVASFLGSTPGCLGAFMNVSFYVHGLISFGAIVGGMIATSGDEAFVMLALFPRDALFLFGLLFVLGIVGAQLADKAASFLGIVSCSECKLQKVHTGEECHCFEPAVLKKFPRLSIFRYLTLVFLFVAITVIGLGTIGPQLWNWQRIILFSLLILVTFIVSTVPDHYLKEHIWNHILKKHLWRVFLWTFFALLFIEVGFQYWNLEGFVAGNIGWILLISALVGIIPESGPHMVFVMMYASGLVPFSVLLTSSIVQDGHGMLPLFSYTVKDSILIKIFNLAFALVVGLSLFMLGL
ncbi:MAG: putative manganese transporter [Candidatus Thermoplasmatota archaeon]|nr:putative manganese transporter [Candidatus Thermoplasmatota archaeon]